MEGKKMTARVMDLGNRLLAQSDAQGALPQLYAATMPDVKGNDYYGPDGLFERAGSPSKVKRTRAARDAAAAEQLWGVSERETGVVYAWKSAQ
jgi:protochlorophyllide reductase